MLPPLIVILGPTAAGKTKLAIQLAKYFNAEIISADSRQIYQGMDIGTDKNINQYRHTPYHLINLITPDHQLTLAEYQQLAIKKLNLFTKKTNSPF